MTDPAKSLLEVVGRFRSFIEWQAWAREHPDIFAAEYTASALEAIRSTGITDPLTRTTYAAAQFSFNTPNYRETIKADLLNSRHRAVLLEWTHVASRGMEHLISRRCRIYAPEGLTDFALYLRGRFPRFLGSEYTETIEESEAIYPIPHDDVTRLSLRSEAFDLVISNDVFEHVPYLDRCLRELARVLDQRGVLISTFPFAFGKQKGTVRAKLRNGTIEHLMQRGREWRRTKGFSEFFAVRWISPLVKSSHPISKLIA